MIREHGGPEALRFEERPVPEPGPGEVRVRVRAVGLNHLDVWVRKGVPGHVFPLPIVPGCDVAGVVDALGPGAAGCSVGDEVVLAPGVSCGVCLACREGTEPLCRSYGILGETRDGGLQELIVVGDRGVLRRPAGLDLVQSAAVPLTFLTAWHMLVARAAVRPGEQVLVHAAGSGVSAAAIQIARFLGARVLATAGSEAKRARAMELGAEEAVDYHGAAFVDAVRRWTGKRGVDVIVDHVGAETFDRSVRCLTKGGRYVTCGATSGYEMKTDFRFIYFKSLSILGSTMGSTHELMRVLDHLGAGRLHAVVDTVLPWEQVAEAHRRLESREVFGKIVLVVGDPV
ncbi:MAG TPA: zinc-binding dehydrogenase [Candidatus Polarisedimenticolaceae bacterium]|nr:zinc-binding dehydrogenase [Candidatus Polarisedimenticolaceae bacterium]